MLCRQVESHHTAPNMCRIGDCYNSHSGNIKEGIHRPELWKCVGIHFDVALKVQILTIEIIFAIFSEVFIFSLTAMARAPFAVATP